MFFFFFLFDYRVYFVFFFFQAEDGIRDRDVTGVQTCALPISARRVAAGAADGALPLALHHCRGRRAEPAPRDRKSTRLNSSHITISYAVFCLKKKNKQTQQTYYKQKKQNHKKQ